MAKFDGYVRKGDKVKVQAHGIVVEGEATTVDHSTDWKTKERSFDLHIKTASNLHRWRSELDGGQLLEVNGEAVTWPVKG